jgi:hypothetical protein
MIAPQMLEKFRWVVWTRFGVDNLKLPINAHSNRPAFKTGTERSSHYATYEQAKHSCYVNGRVGVGYDIREPEIGIDVDDWDTFPHKDFMLGLNTFMEDSPSGKGKHLIVSLASDELHRSLPNQVCKKGLEVYMRKRWFTVTGKSNGKDVRTISIEKAKELLSLADPLWEVKEKLERESESSGEPGPWTHYGSGGGALNSCLQSWKALGQGFDFQRVGDRFQILCPGNTLWGWPDGSKHSHRGPQLTNKSEVWLRNHRPVFMCFSATCNGECKRTWKDLASFWDPSRTWTVEKWLEQQLKEMGLY